MEVRSQRSEVNDKRERSVFDRLRGISSLALVAVLAFATLVPGRAAFVFAQKPQAAPATQQPGTVPAQVDYARLAAAAAAQVTEFDVNGLKVLVKRREGSLTASAGLFIRGGSTNITADNAGIEGFMLSAATEASANFPRERMRKETSRMGTVIGGSASYDYSVLSLTSTRANFDRSWEIFTDVALHPSFTKEDVALVQSRILAGLQGEADDPDGYLQRLQERVAYVGHPYLNRPEGTAENVSRLTAEDLRAYHQKIMQTSRSLLVIVGDLDAAQLKPRIAAAFGKLPRGDYKPQTPPPLAFTSSTVEVTSRPLPTNYIQGLFTAPSINSPDIYPMRVASSLLRDRVFEEVRVKRNLSYAPDAFLRNQSANIGGLYVTAVDANQAVRVMLNEITRLQREPISRDDINSVIAQFLTSYYIGQETNGAQAAELAQYELIGGGWRNSLNFLERLRAVTPAEVQRVSQKYMRNIRFVVLGNPAQIDKAVFTGQAGT
ncbi:MAG TPA: pitrilysin family protein [Pyrinomonadaceae bacterium]|nr:pitrilysin family protein [Pyrinomonadaceae bacterium]